MPSAKQLKQQEKMSRVQAEIRDNPGRYEKFAKQSDKVSKAWKKLFGKKKKAKH